MPYQYLEDIATADVAFKASGNTVEEMFISSAEALMNVMVEDLNTVAPIERRLIELKNENLEMLLFEFLQELIFFKDAEVLLLRVPRLQIKRILKEFQLEAIALGEEINPQKHVLNVDVKAVTMHLFKVQELQNGWEAVVVLDI